MSLRLILEKFAEGFSVTGIFLQTPQETFPIIQQKADSLLIVKRHPNLQAGITEIKIDDNIMGVLTESLDDETNIVIVAAPKYIQEIAAHWKRFLPVVKKQIEIEEFIRQESIETKLVNRLEDIRVALQDTTVILKEKMNSDREF
ncbi:MAG: hypothetical protein ACFFB2_01300 [Promethearchaeota archaeon]